MKQLLLKFTVLVAFAFALMTCSKNNSVTGINPITTIPKSGLVAYYPFNGNARDTSGNNHNGTIYGATLTTDRFGTANGAYFFAGNSQYIEVPDDSTLDCPALTISLWAKVQSFSSVKMGTDANYQFLLFKENTRVTQFEGYSIGLDEGQRRFSGGVSSTSGLQRIIAAPDSSAQIGQWVNITLTADSNKVQFYLNGVKTDTLHTGFALNYGSRPLRFGRTADANFDGFFSGSLDDIAIYNRVLSEKEVMDLQQAKGY